MGGNTYNRKYFKDSELLELIKKIDKYRALFDDRIFSSEKAWRANISRHLDKDSANRFFFMIEELKGVPSCCSCLEKLTIESFTYSGDIKGFCKYCPKCTIKGAWRYRENYDLETLTNRGRKITQAKLEFFRTEKGKEIAKNTGKKISVSLKEFHKTIEGETARKKSAEVNSKIMREKILSGKFTPNSNNRNTHWDAEFNGKKYRSSWEALYQYHNPYAKYESLRILYTYNNKESIYIVDFVDHLNKIVTEVKPKELLLDEKTKSKISSLRKWAQLNGYAVLIFGLDEIKNTPEPDYSLFDEFTTTKLKRIYENIKN